VGHLNCPLTEGSTQLQMLLLTRERLYLQPSTLAKRAWFLLFIAIAAIYLFGLGRIPLVGPDEPRYAEVAREMLSRHDFITPTLGGMPCLKNRHSFTG